MANLKMSESQRRQTSEIQNSPECCQLTKPPLTPSPTFQKMSVHFWLGLVSAKSLYDTSMRTHAEEKIPGQKREKMGK